MSTMMDHNVLRDEISAASRYRKLQDLKLTIEGLKRKLPLSIAAELEARVTEKLRTFDYPICSVARIKIIFSNGLSKYLDQDECQKAMARGMKLSDYLFSRYISVKDFEISSSEILGSRNFGIYSEPSKVFASQNEEFTPLSSEELRERLDFLSKRVESLERVGTIYAENIPKLARDMNDLKEKVDKIYRKVIER